MDSMYLLRRHWIIAKNAIPNKAERCDFMDQVCAYAFDGKEPVFLFDYERAIFDDMREALHLARIRSEAQEKSVQKRLQNKLQKRLQNDLQNDLQNGLQNNLQNPDLQMRLQMEKEKKKQLPSLPPGPPLSPLIEKEKERHSAHTSAPADARICAAPDFFRMIPENLRAPEFIAAWKEWEVFRKEKRKPISDRAAKTQLTALSRAGVAAAIEAIEEAIRNDYQGLFPQKHKPTSTPAAAPVYTQNERGAK